MEDLQPTPGLLLAQVVRNETEADLLNKSKTHTALHPLILISHFLLTITHYSLYTSVLSLMNVSNCIEYNHNCILDSSCTYVLTIQLGNYWKTEGSQEVSVPPSLMFYFTMNDKFWAD